MSTTILDDVLMAPDFPAVGLDDLVAEADLQSRIDRKYLLPAGQTRQLLDAFPAGSRVLEIDARRTFGYESTYFDSADLRCYLDAARRRKRRFKVRTRHYTDTGLCRLEVKTRDGRGHTVKTATAYAAEDCGRLTGPAQDQVARATGGRQSLATSLVTQYRRTTVVLPGFAARVTLDTGIAFSLPGGPRVTLDDWTIVETKAGHAASAVDRLLWQQGHRPIKVSKYGTGLALLRPDLPANKWHRTIRTITGSSR